MDCLLGAALSDILSGDLERRVGVLKEQAAKEDKLLKGRQVLHFIYEYYRVAEADGAVLEFEDLVGLRMRHNNLEEFATAWGGTLTAMVNIPQDSILEALYKVQIKSHPMLREHMAYYERLELGHEEKLTVTW